MRTILITSLLVLAAACAGTKKLDPEAADAGAIIGDVGDPRARAKSHTELAAAYYQRSNLGVALEELRIATAADPGYAPAHSLLGLVYMDLKEQSLAAQSFERALNLAPNDGDINHNYGVFLCQTKREPDSIKYFMQAVKNPLYATPSRSWSAAGVCTLRTDRPKEAEQYFERALRLQPDEPAALLNLGQIRDK